MFIYFDPAGVVKRTETGLDPWAIRGMAVRTTSVFAV